MNTVLEREVVCLCIPDSSLCFTVSADHEYMVPKRAVTSVEDMQIWEKSEAYFVCCKTNFN
jgi:hypothetical protein